MGLVNDVKDILFLHLFGVLTLIYCPYLVERKRLTTSLLLLRLRIATFDDVSAVNVAILLPLKAFHPLLATARLHIDVGQGELLGLLLVTGLRTALWLSHVH